MSAVVLGKRSSCFFEDLHLHSSAAATSQSSPSSASKKARFGSSSFRFSPAVSSSARESDHYRFVGGSQTVLEHLRSLFPDMDEQILEKVLEASGNDLDSAIRSLNKLRLGSDDSSNPTEIVSQPSVEAGSGANEMESLPTLEGSEWIEILVREMMNAANMDEAKARAATVLEAFEKTVAARAAASTAENLQKEREMLKDQVEGLVRENEILKKAVAIQHERQKEFEDKSREISHLKQLLAQYQEQLRTLEVNNYALSLHLRQAQQSSSIPGRFHPDVF